MNVVNVPVFIPRARTRTVFRNDAFLAFQHSSRIRTVGRISILSFFDILRLFFCIGVEKKKNAKYFNRNNNRSTSNGGGEGGGGNKKKIVSTNFWRVPRATQQINRTLRSYVGSDRNLIEIVST